MNCKIVFVKIIFLSTATRARYHPAVSGDVELQGAVTKELKKVREYGLGRLDELNQKTGKPKVGPTPHLEHAAEQVPGYTNRVTRSAAIELLITHEVRLMRAIPCREWLPSTFGLTNETRGKSPHECRKAAFGVAFALKATSSYGNFSRPDGGDEVNSIGVLAAQIVADCLQEGEVHVVDQIERQFRETGSARIRAYDPPVQPVDSESNGNGPSGYLRRVSELDDPFALEVHPAIRVPGSASVQHRELPHYVPRDHDRHLAEVVALVSSGRSGIAVLVGDSSTGKTRACWEAIRREGALSPEWRLWHPIGPQALLDELPNVGPHTVLWLNETQNYLLTVGSALGDEVAAGLRELLRDPARGPVLVLGTLWRSYEHVLMAQPTGNDPDLHRHARHLVSDARINVSEVFGELELRDVRIAARTDPRLAAALMQAKDGEITQFLAGSVELVRLYRNAPPAAKALIEAAVDCRRLGHSQALPLNLLQAAAYGYLTTAQWDSLPEDWFAQALAYCGQLALGARGPLTRIRPRPGHSHDSSPLYRLSDYLEQLGSVGRASTAAPESLWDALVEYAAVADRTAIGNAAYLRGLCRHAAYLYTSAGSIDALVKAAWMLVDADRTDEAIALFQGVTRAGDNRYLREAAKFLSWAGHKEEALSWAQAAASEPGSSSKVIVFAAAALAELGRIDDALIYCRRAIDAAGDKSAAIDQVEIVLRDNQRIAELPQILEGLAKAGHRKASMTVGKVLIELGRSEEALPYYERVVFQDDDAVEQIALILSGAGRISEALIYLEHLAARGKWNALVVAAEQCRHDGLVEQSIHYCRRVLQESEGEAARRRAIGVLLRLGISEAYNTLAAIGDRSLFDQAAFVLRSYWHRDHLLEFCRYAIESEDLSFAGLYVETLHKAGRVEEALLFMADADASGKLDRGTSLSLLRAEDLTTLVTLHQSVVGQEGAESPRASCLGLFVATLEERIQEALQHQAKPSAGAAESEAVTRGPEAGNGKVGNAGAGNNGWGVEKTFLRLARISLDAGRTQEALNYYWRAAAAGIGGALDYAAHALHVTGRPEDARRLRQFGWNPDGSIADPWTIQ